MRHLGLLFLIPVPILAACTTPECAAGFTLGGGDGGCVLDVPGDCGDGQVRTIEGECVDPYVTVNGSANDDDDDDTDTTEDTGEALDTDDLVDTDWDFDTDDGDTDLVDTDFVPDDTGSPVIGGTDCSHTITMTTSNYASEVGFQVTPSGSSTPLVSVAIGDLTINNTTYTYDVTMPVGTYTVNMVDDYGDGWNGGQLTLYHDATGNLVDSATLGSGASNGTDTWTVTSCAF